MQQMSAYGLLDRRDRILQPIDTILGPTDTILCWQSLAIVLIKILL